MAELNTGDYVWMGRNPNVTVEQVKVPNYGKFQSEIDRRTHEYELGVAHQKGQLRSDPRMCTSEKHIRRALGRVRENEPGEEILIQAFTAPSRIVQVTRGRYADFDGTEPGPIEGLVQPYGINVDCIPLVDLEGNMYAYVVRELEPGSVHLTQHCYVKPEYFCYDSPLDCAVDRALSLNQLTARERTQDGIMYSGYDGTLFVGYRVVVDKNALVDQFHLEPEERSIKLVDKKVIMGGQPWLVPIPEIPELVELNHDGISQWTSLHIQKFLQEGLSE